MTEFSLLVELSELLECKTDQILSSTPVSAVNANFDHILLPYAPIADFTVPEWYVKESDRMRIKDCPKTSQDTRECRGSQDKKAGIYRHTAKMQRTGCGWIKGAY